MYNFITRTSLYTTAALLLLGACTPLVEGSDKASNLAKEIVDHTRNSWKDVFAYRKPKPEQLPQTRYCYNTMSDIVCYDSVQANNTSQLNGYQDGDNISWVQPGGGSLGVSGGDATAQVNAEHAQIAPNAVRVSSHTGATTNEIASTPIAPPTPTGMSVDTSPPKAAATSAGGAKGSSDPFYRKESPYVKDAKAQ